MSKDECGCTFEMDDWNHTKSYKCESCRRKEHEEKRKWAVEEAEKTGDCFNCLMLDTFGRRDEGGSYHTKGECGKCYEKRMKNLCDFYKIKDRDDKSEVLSSPILRDEYRRQNPKSRGYETIKFKKWAYKKMQSPRWNWKYDY